ncbi:MAG: hypothetical protein AAF630_21130, partial [Cyanobacteria bacterium P01_C01_bin.38]
MGSTTLLLSILIIGYNAFQQTELPVGNYVVVGAYSINQEYYAKAFTTKLNEQGHNANYGLSHSKNLFFVYLSQNQDFEVALREMRKVRQTEQFSDAWVFVNRTGPAAASDSAIPSRTKEQRQENYPDQVDSSAENEDNSTTTSQYVLKENTVTSEETTNSETSEEIILVEDAEPVSMEKVEAITKLSQIGFKVNLYNAQTSSAVKGSVQLVDTERAKRLKKFQGGEEVTIENPDNGSGKLSVIVDNFGFRKQQKEINFFNPLKDTARVDISFEEGVLQLNFDLIRYSVGDFVVMYNVAFFKDAAVMRPESKFEV